MKQDTLQQQWKDVVYYRTEGYPETSDTQSWFEDPEEKPVVRLDTPLSFTLEALVLPVLRAGNTEKGFLTKGLRWKKKSLHLVIPRTPWTSRLLDQIHGPMYIHGLLCSDYWDAFQTFQKTLSRKTNGSSTPSPTCPISISSLISVRDDYPPPFWKKSHDGSGMKRNKGSFPLPRFFFHLRL